MAFGQRTYNFYDTMWVLTAILFHCSENIKTCILLYHSSWLHIPNFAMTLQVLGVFNDAATTAEPI